MSINDIQTVLGPFVDERFAHLSDGHSLYEIYEDIYKLEQRQYFDTESSIIKALELADSSFSENEDEYLNKFTFLSLLTYDIFMKKKLMEHIVDEMAAEQETIRKAAEEREANKKQTAKKEPKRASSKKDITDKNKKK